MDELLIEDKKYVSSKRAAKLTGYAKDYVGQLCREGRVPARLVGRSWYVLETALQDHRFGSHAPAAVEKVPASTRSIYSSGWESSRYEVSPAEILPSIHRQVDMETLLPVDADQNQESDISGRLQDSWREWFDRIAESKPILSTAKEALEEEKEPKRQEDEGVNIPVRAVHHSLSAELLPRTIKDYSYVKETEIEEQAEPGGSQEEQTAGRRTVIGLHLVGVLIALLTVTTAIIGTGYFDQYILSASQVRAVAGLGLYNR